MSFIPEKTSKGVKPAPTTTVRNVANLENNMNRADGVPFNVTGTHEEVRAAGRRVRNVFAQRQAAIAAGGRY